MPTEFSSKLQDPLLGVRSLCEDGALVVDIDVAFADSRPVRYDSLLDQQIRTLRYWFDNPVGFLTTQDGYTSPSSWDEQLIKCWRADRDMLGSIFVVDDSPWRCGLAEWDTMGTRQCEHVCFVSHNTITEVLGVVSEKAWFGSPDDALRNFMSGEDPKPIEVLETPYSSKVH